LAITWLLLHRSSLQWAFATFTHSDYRLNLVLLIAALALVGAYSIRSLGEGRVQLRLEPSFELVPFAVVALSVGSARLVDHAFDVDILSASFFVSGSYGLLGLFVSRITWVRAGPIAMMLVLTLPFGAQAQAYAGFSARAFTAGIVHQTLAALGVTAMPAQTIVLLENGLAHVDVPCSGIRSLWAGALFFSGATWISGRRFGPRWLFAASSLIALLIGANAVRVFVLILVGVVWQQAPIASMLHVPLGLLGFLGACAGSMWVLGKGPAPAAVSPPGPCRECRWLSPLLISLFAVGALSPAPVSRPSLALRAFELRLPESWDQQSVELTAQETDLFGRFGAREVAKHRFSARGVRGSILTVSSRSWRAHHPPELCLAGNGFELGSTTELRLATGDVARIVALDQDRRAAVYWFQSPTRTTGDLLERVQGEVFGGERRWVLVSVLLERPSTWVLESSSQVILDIHRAVDLELKGTKA
jgi:exosortase O